MDFLQIFSAAPQTTGLRGLPASAQDATLPVPSLRDIPSYDFLSNPNSNSTKLAEQSFEAFLNSVSQSQIDAPPASSNVVEETDTRLASNVTEKETLVFDPGPTTETSLPNSRQLPTGKTRTTTSPETFSPTVSNHLLLKFNTRDNSATKADSISKESQPSPVPSRTPSNESEFLQIGSNNHLDLARPDISNVRGYSGADQVPERARIFNHQIPAEKGQPSLKTETRPAVSQTPAVSRHIQSNEIRETTASDHVDQLAKPSKVNRLDHQSVTKSSRREIRFNQPIPTVAETVGNGEKQLATSETNLLHRLQRNANTTDTVNAGHVSTEGPDQFVSGAQRLSPVAVRIDQAGHAATSNRSTETTNTNSDNASNTKTTFLSKQLANSHHESLVSRPSSSLQTAPTEAPAPHQTTSPVETSIRKEITLRSNYLNDGVAPSKTQSPNFSDSVVDETSRPLDQAVQNESQRKALNTQPERVSEKTPSTNENNPSQRPLLENLLSNQKIDLPNPKPSLQDSTQSNAIDTKGNRISNVDSEYTIVKSALQNSQPTVSEQISNPVPPNKTEPTSKVKPVASTSDQEAFLLTIGKTTQIDQNSNRNNSESREFNLQDVSANTTRQWSPNRREKVLDSYRANAQVSQPETSAPIQTPTPPFAELKPEVPQSVSEGQSSQINQSSSTLEPIDFQFNRPEPQVSFAQGTFDSEKTLFASRTNTEFDFGYRSTLAESVQEILTQRKTETKPDVTQIKLQINPPEFGPIEISISHSGGNGTSTASITVTSEYALNQLQANLHSLEGTLESLNIDLQDVTTFERNSRHGSDRDDAQGFPSDSQDSMTQEKDTQTAPHRDGIAKGPLSVEVGRAVVIDFYA